MKDIFYEFLSDEIQMKNYNQNVHETFFIKPIHLFISHTYNRRASGQIILINWFCRKPTIS